MRKYLVLLTASLASSIFIGCGHSYYEISKHINIQKLSLYDAERLSQNNFLDRSDLVEYMQHNNNELCKLAMINDDKTFKYILYTSKNIDFNDVTCLLSNQKYDYVDLIEKDFSLKKIVDTKNNNLLHYAVYNNDFESVNYLALKNTKLKTLKNVENKLPMDYVTHANFRVANIVYVNTENLK